MIDPDDIALLPSENVMRRTRLVVGFLIGCVLSLGALLSALPTFGLSPATTPVKTLPGAVMLTPRRQQLPDGARSAIWLSRHGAVDDMPVGQTFSGDPLSALSQSDPADIANLLKAADFRSATYGAGPVHLTVLLDPACLPCRRLWQSITQVHHWQQEFTVRLVPVNFIGSGAGEASRILARHPPPAKIDFAAASDNRAARAAVRHNTKAWIAMTRKMGAAPGLPVLIVNHATLSIGALSKGMLDALALSWPMKVPPAPRH